ncbi:hypothetical protein B0H13DRAFT_1906370 [Mycena leptocephala]|nr:hypothetical protein B0H13DRAFT_1906370 [Mycena leptocephala]
MQMKARKTRKTFFGGEAVWPLELEAALLEGNRRTPKQVGSRLQQLRESRAGGQLLQFLSPLRKPPSSGSFASTDSVLSSPTLPVGDELFSNRSSSRHTVMYIDILPERSPDIIHSESSSSGCTFRFTPVQGSNQRFTDIAVQAASNVTFVVLIGSSGCQVYEQKGLGKIQHPEYDYQVV